MDPTLFQTIWPTFSGESREHLEALGSGLLTLERPVAERPSGLLGGLRRVAHTLKGSAGSIGLSDVEQVVHAIEDALGAEETAPFSREAVGALLAAVASIEAMVDRVEAGGSERIPEAQAHLEAIRAACRDGGRDAVLPPLPAATPAPTSETDGGTERGAPAPGAFGELWPVFRGEVFDHVATLQATLERAHKQQSLPDDADLEYLQAIAASLEGAAQTVGRNELGDAARRLMLALASAEAGAGDLGALGGAVEAISAALEDVDQEEAIETRPAEDGSGEVPERVRELFRSEASETISAMEAGLGALLAPGASPAREEALEAFSRRTHNLRGSAAAVGADACVEVLERIEAALPELQTPGLAASRAAARLASLVLELETAVRGLASGSEKSEARAPEQPTAASSARPEAPAGAAPRRASVRVATGTLDTLIRQVEGLLHFSQRQERHARSLAALVGVLDGALLEHQRALSELRQVEAEGAMSPLTEAMESVRGVRRGLAEEARRARREAEQLRLGGVAAREDLRDLRTLAASTVLEPLRRTVREVASRIGKDVELVLEGEEVRVDRRVLDEIREPLLHLVRNAVDHGIETATERSEAGKPARGTVKVSVRSAATRVHFVIEDDGSGLSLERIRAAALRRGIATEDGLARLSEDETFRLIFRAGFSTTSAVSEISGRGVGMDVVQQVVNQLQGRIGIETHPGRGTRFTLDLPLTLASGMFVLVQGAGASCAVPMESVERTLRLRKGDVGSVAGRPVVTVDGEQLPFVSLWAVVGEKAAQRTRVELGGVEQALVLSSAGARAVVAVEEIRGVEELVVQSLGRRLQQSTHLSGAATLDDGSLVAVLNPAELVARARDASRPADRTVRRRILVADDALTTRMAMKSLLDIAGYEVVVAADGVEALRLLTQSPFDLLVTDVQMPNLDGLGLTRQVKADPNLSRTPVLLVTSLEDPNDRAAGLEAGADGYLVKREVERGALLELVHQLLPLDRSGA